MRIAHARRAAVVAAAGTAGLAVALAGAVPATAAGPSGPDAVKSPSAVGTGGAVASVDLEASRVGLQVLARGGNAADAAIATAAALGVTEPYSAGIGGGGFLVYHDAETGEVTTIDGRETAPSSFTPTTFQAADGTPLPFFDVVNSGLSVGVPGTPALWDLAARRFGTKPLADLLLPAERLARDGFTVDETFAEQTEANAERFSLFPETARVYLPGGQVPVVGSTFRNPDLARAYRVLRTQGVDALYTGSLGEAVVATAQAPGTADGVEVLAGELTTGDLAAYEALEKEPTYTQYRGLDVYGMPVPSSGGTTVAQALNLLEAYDARTRTRLADVPRSQYFHRFSEATATAFADRNRWVGDVPDVPVDGLLSQEFADARACELFDPRAAQPRPLPFGDPTSPAACGVAAGVQASPRDDHGTTHLTVADRWGNVAAYTLTIEQTGGSGITVPGYGFLLNNELTDFSFAAGTPGVPDPNLPGPGKRPRSSMAPTIVVDAGEPVLALGSPGGATIITTVTQVLTGYLDRGLPLVEAVAAPRLSSRNGGEQAEPAVLASPLAGKLTRLGHVLTPVEEIGAATAIAIRPDGSFVAAAERERRGGGSALVVRPRG